MTVELTVTGTLTLFWEWRVRSVTRHSCVHITY